MNIFEGLNDPQRLAVESNQGPLLVMAGAGSGKTRVLTTKIAHLIRNNQVRPDEILAITFTNKAAQEMKERVTSMIPDSVKEMWVCTFHSACMRILRRQATFFGYRPGFTIYDDSDQQTVIKACLKALDIDDKKLPPRSVSAAISQAKNRLVGPEEFEAQAYDYFSKQVTRVYRLYQQTLVRNNALDFDDILMVTVNLLREQPSVAKYYQSKFKYILVDEYQDTNHAQYAFIQILAKVNRNICVVGDPDQGIYSWRGADISNILEFEKDYPETKIIVLDRNYRSTKTILDAANHLIRHNPDRREKKLWTASDEGRPIIAFAGDTERVEADYVSDRIQRLHSQEKISYKEMAVFYRTNAMSRVLEESLIRRGIPYRIIGGLRFYDRKEIKDIMSYLKLLVNPSDEVSFARIINVPKRAVGEASISKMLDYSLYNEVDLIATLKKVAVIKGISAKAKKACEELGNLLGSYKDRLNELSVTQIVQGLLADTGYLAELEAEKTVESQSRQENLKEFLSVTTDFDRNAEDPFLTEFLSGIALVSDIENLDQESEQISLITLHSAKGLEFPVVFLIGMEEGVFPHTRVMDDPQELHEERRLAYVGITRAKKILYLTRCWQRTLYGFTKFNEPSRFLKEIPPGLFAGHDPLDGEPAGKASAPSMGFKGVVTGASLWGRQSKDSTPVPSFVKGDEVNHVKWGAGKITGVRGMGDSAELTIDFPGLGVKTLLAKYAPLKKLS
ncbi:MAG: DNA helicase PcrA [Peptococcaceae bacterium]|nr:DNA helicase PcrA [Peptococcaceae bacterium]